MQNEATVYVFSFGDEKPSDVLKGNNLLNALMEKWDRFPEGAKIYLGTDAVDDKELHVFNDETQRYASRLTGEFTVVLFPRELFTIIAIVIGVVAVAAAFLMQPKVPNVSQGGAAAESANNKLGDRENTPRLKGMIPEIYGKIRATPDLIMQNYSIYIDHVKVEYSYMCLGVGRYDFTAEDVYEDVTPISSVQDIVFEAWNPNQSPLNVRDNPFVKKYYNKWVRDTVWTCIRHNSVNGQKLQATNTDIHINGQFIWTGAYRIIRESDTNKSWDGNVFVGDSITISNVGSPYNGTFTVDKVDGNDLYVSGASWTSDSSANQNIHVEASSATRWTDWFIFDTPDMTMPYVNVSAPNGLFYVNNDNNQESVDAGISVEIQLCNADGSNALVPSTTNQKATGYIIIDRMPYSNVASGWVNFTLNGVNFVFTSSTTLDTIEEIVDYMISTLNASSDTRLNVATYSKVGTNKIFIEYDTAGIIGESYTIEAITGTTASSDTLTGGVLELAYSSIIKTFTVRGSDSTKSTRGATIRANVYALWLHNEQVGVSGSGSTTDIGYVRDAILHVYTENVDPSKFYRISRFCNYDLTSTEVRGDQIMIGVADTKYGTLSNWGSYGYNNDEDFEVTFNKTGSVYQLRSTTINFSNRFPVGSDIRITDRTSSMYSGVYHVESFSSNGAGTNNYVTLSGTPTGSWSSGTSSIQDITIEWYGYTLNSHKRPVWVTVTSNTDENAKIHLLIDYRKIRTVTVDDTGDITSITPSTTVTSGASRPISSDSGTDNLKFLFSNNIHYGGGHRMKVRVRRNTTRDWSAKNLVDEIKLDDVFGMSSVKKTDFGNVTTIAMETKQTAQPSSLKKRKLNILCTRKIKCRNQSGNYIDEQGYAVDASEAEYLPTRRLDHILGHIATYPTLGNYPSDQVDWNGLYDMTGHMGIYFGGEDLQSTGTGYPLMPSSTQFNYTFDKDDMSFEEMMKTACASWFIEPYRRGNLIRFTWETQKNVSDLLFNHRSKMPASEKRTINLGRKGDYDGVEMDWVNPDSADLIETMTIPSDGSAVNPYKIEVVGVRSRWHAFLHCIRAWQKIKHQNTTVEFEALPEANILARTDRILVADNTRPQTMDGDILAVSGSVLTLSQKCDITGLISPNIFLQLANGTVQSFPISQGSDKKKVTITGTPSMSLVTSSDAYVRTTFQIIGTGSTNREQAFIVSEKTPTENGNVTLQAINYDDAYYFGDKTRFWFEPISQEFVDRTPFGRQLYPVNGAIISMDGSTLASGRGYTYYSTSATSYMRVNDKKPLKLSSNFTISAWVKLSTSLLASGGGYTQDYMIVSSKGGGNVNLLIRQYIANNFEIKGIFNFGSEEAIECAFTYEPSLSASTPASKWHHVVWTYEIGSGTTNGTFKLYLDGDLKATRGSVDHHANDWLTIGGSDAATKGFIGRLDDVRVFTDTFNANQVKRLYLTTKNTTGETKV